MDVEAANRTVGSQRRSGYTKEGIVQNDNCDGRGSLRSWQSGHDRLHLRGGENVEDLEFGRLS